MFLMLHIVELYLKAGQKRLMTGGERKLWYDIRNVDLILFI